jgi:hypothetical protein
MPGVCFQLLRINGQDFYGFIFVNGAYDRFRADDVSSSLDYSGVICPEVADYTFRSVLQLNVDHRRGRFTPAFRMACEGV